MGNLSAAQRAQLPTLRQINKALLTLPDIYPTVTMEMDGSIHITCSNDTECQQVEQVLNGIGLRAHFTDLEQHRVIVV